MGQNRVRESLEEKCFLLRLYAATDLPPPDAEQHLPAGEYPDVGAAASERVPPPPVLLLVPEERVGRPHLPGGGVRRQGQVLQLACFACIERSQSQW